MYFNINELNFDVSKHKDKFYYDAISDRFYYFSRMLNRENEDAKYGMVELHCTATELPDFEPILDITNTGFVYKPVTVYLYKCYSISNKYREMNSLQFRSLIKYSDSDLNNFILYFER